MTLHIQNFLQFAFIAVMFAPLPILLLSSPLSYVKEQVARKRYYSIVKRYFENPSTVSAEQLSDIFPNKKLNELHEIAYSLKGEKSFRDN